MAAVNEMKPTLGTDIERGTLIANFSEGTVCFTHVLCC